MAFRRHVIRPRSHRASPFFLSDSRPHPELWACLINLPTFRCFALSLYNIHWGGVELKRRFRNVIADAI